MYHGFDPYSPLYYLIRDYFIKLASLEFILTRVDVFSMTLQIRFIKHPLTCAKKIIENTISDSYIALAKDLNTSNSSSQSLIISRANDISSPI